MRLNKYLILMAVFFTQAEVIAQDTEQYCRKYLRDLESQRASLHANPGYRSYAPVYKPMSGRSNVDAAQVLKSLQEHLIAHHQNCQNRQDCMRADLATIDKFRDDHHEAVDIINRFKAELKKQFEADVLPTELTVYQQLSSAGQQLYYSGIILTLPQQMPVNNQKQQQDLYYNLDEMLIAVLQQLNKAHQTCNNRQACLQQDIQLLANLQQKYYRDQRFVNQLDSLIQLINQANN